MNTFKEDQDWFFQLPLEMRKTNHRGWSAYYDRNTLNNLLIRFMDSGEDVEKFPRSCKKCRKFNEESEGETYDACIGKLPGVKFACCGHGGEGYIVFQNGKTIRFNSMNVE